MICVCVVNWLLVNIQGNKQCLIRNKCECAYDELN